MKFLSLSFANYTVIIADASHVGKCFEALCLFEGLCVCICGSTPNMRPRNSCSGFCQILINVTRDAKALRSWVMPAGEKRNRNANQLICPLGKSCFTELLFLRFLEECCRKHSHEHWCHVCSGNVVRDAAYIMAQRFVRIPLEKSHLALGAKKSSASSVFLPFWKWKSTVLSFSLCLP